jgi:hypothetical protein
MEIRGCIQKFPDWQPGATAPNNTNLCHKVQLYRYFVSQCSEFCRRNPLCCFSASVYCCCCLFRYRLSPETFGYTLLYLHSFLTSVPDGNEQSHLRSGCFTPGTHWIGGGVGLRDRLDGVAKRKIPSPRRESTRTICNPPNQQLVAQVMKTEEE